MDNDKTTKRERGTGTIKKIDGKQYLARIQYTSPKDGKIHDKKKLCSSENEAKRIVREWQNKIIQESTLDYNNLGIRVLFCDGSDGDTIIRIYEAFA